MDFDQCASSESSVSLVKQQIIILPQNRREILPPLLKVMRQDLYGVNPWVTNNGDSRVIQK